MRNYLAEWIADLRDKEELVYAPIELPREIFQILQYVGKKSRGGARNYLTLTWLLAGGLGMMLGGLFAEEVYLVLVGTSFAAFSMLGIYLLGRGYKYKPGQPLSWGKPSGIYIFDEAGFTGGLRERVEEENAKLKASLGHGTIQNKDLRKKLGLE